MAVMVVYSACGPRRDGDFGVGAIRQAIERLHFARNGLHVAPAPGHGAYWLLWPGTGLFRPAGPAGRLGEIRKTLRQVDRPCCRCASADITVKMVVPTWGKRDERGG